MAFPPGDYFYLTVRGNITGGESWSFSHWQELTGLIDLPDPADLQTVCDSCEAHAATLWAQLKTHNNAGVSYTGLNMRFVRNGVSIYSNQTNEATAIPGTGGQTIPMFVARVVTLQTARAGRSYRGRMYLPYTGSVPVSGTPLWTSDTTTLTAVKSFMASCAAEIGTLPDAATYGPVVYSATVGGHEPVIGLRMDNKPDTQRGRERSIAATIFDQVAF